MSEAIEQARELLCELTPLTADCGQICGGNCCHASEGREGMLLFPGEERLYEHSDFRLIPTAGGVLLTCNGTCDRNHRPLACRIFPLFPQVDENGRVHAVYDPRGWRLCPLLLEAAHVSLDRRFVRAVRRAGRILMSDPACAAFLREQSEEIDVLNRLLPLKDVRSPIQRRKISTEKGEK